MMNGKCCCVCHKVPGALIVAVGVVFLLGALNILNWNLVGILWPIFVIIFGLKMICKCKCCSGESCKPEA